MYQLQQNIIARWIYNPTSNKNKFLVKKITKNHQQLHNIKFQFQFIANIFLHYIGSLNLCIDFILYNFLCIYDIPLLRNENQWNFKIFVCKSLTKIIASFSVCALYRPFFLHIENLKGINGIIYINRWLKWFIECKTWQRSINEWHETWMAKYKREIFRWKMNKLNGISDQLCDANSWKDFKCYPKKGQFIDLNRVFFVERLNNC